MGADNYFCRYIDRIVNQICQPMNDLRQYY